MMVSNKTKQKAADSLLENGMKFQVKAFGLNLKFSIKKLVLGTLIQISQEQSKLNKPNSKTTTADVISEFSNDCKPMARIIALAVCNSKFQPLRKSILTWIFLKTLTSQELEKLTYIVVDSMGTDFFFRSSISIRGIDLLNQTNKMVTDQPGLSGEE